MKNLLAKAIARVVFWAEVVRLSPLYVLPILLTAAWWGAFVGLLVLYSGSGPSPAAPLVAFALLSVPVAVTRKKYGERAWGQYLRKIQEGTR